MSLKIQTECEITADDILDSSNYPAIIELIKDIDSGAAMWDLTEELYNYFKDQMAMKDTDLGLRVHTKAQ